MYQIFISYRRLGGEALAFLLHEKLTAEGYKVFYDIESLDSGRFDTKLLKIMDECSDVVLVLPPNSLERCKNEDDWLRQEIVHAIKTGKNIIPLTMNGFVFPSDLPDELSTLQNYQRVKVDFIYFDGVLDHIKRYLHAGKNLNKNNSSSNPDYKHILLWSDFDSAILDKLIKKLDFDDNYDFEILEDALDILSNDLSKIDTIILMTTDVTKFTNNSSALARLNQCLVDYVRSGGRLICAHDIIYRRTRNTQLQELYGCTITNFERTRTVRYVKTDICKEEGLFESLLDSFSLTDGEVCWGELAPDVNVYFETENGYPLVFSREYGTGICLYFNSGDYNNTAPGSILKPEKQFVLLLRELINFEY